MKLKYITTLAATLIFAATSCSDDDWQPGPDVNPDCMTVYFEPLSSYNLVIGPDDSRLIPVTIGRAKYQEAATVNLNITELPEGVYMPSAIDFEAGEQSKTIFIDIENMPSKSTGTIAISIPEELTSPYAAGNSAITININVAGAWVPLANKTTVSIMNGSNNLYPSFNADVYVLDGTYQFKIANFLNSGVDFVFTVEHPGTGNVYILPVRNYIDVHEVYGDDYEYDGWLFFDQATDTYPVWSPDGSYPDIVSVEFDNSYSYMNLDEGQNYIFFSPYISFSDGTAGYYNIWFQFTPLFNPFAQGDDSGSADE